MVNLNGISVVIQVDNRQVAIPAEYVREMVSMPGCTGLPNTPAHVRGVVNLRGRVLPAVDTRVLLGMKSARAEAEQLVDMLKQREEEHRRWITELEASIRECRDFHLATDPTKCAFGKRFYPFKAD
jgi:purine-binding chemotaxis protein CheW